MMMTLNVKFTLSSRDSVELMCDYMGQETKAYSKKRFLEYAKKRLETYGLYFHDGDFNQEGKEPILEALKLIKKYQLRDCFPELEYVLFHKKEG